MRTLLLRKLAATRRTSSNLNPKTNSAIEIFNMRTTRSTGILRKRKRNCTFLGINKVDSHHDNGINVSINNNDDDNSPSSSSRSINNNDGDDMNWKKKKNVNNNFAQYQNFHFMEDSNYYNHHESTMRTRMVHKINTSSSSSFSSSTSTSSSFSCSLWNLHLINFKRKNNYYQQHQTIKKQQPQLLILLQKRQQYHHLSIVHENSKDIQHKACERKEKLTTTNNCTASTRTIDNEQYENIILEDSKSSIPSSSSTTLSSSSTPPTPPTPTLKAMNKRYLFQYLKLKTYSNEEIDEAFDTIVNNNLLKDTNNVLNDDTDNSNDNNNNNNNAKTTTVAINEQNLVAFILERIIQIDTYQQQQKQGNKDNNDNITINQVKQKEMITHANNEAKRMIQLLLLQQNQNRHSNNIIQYQSNHNTINPPTIINNNSFTMDKSTFQEQIRTLATKIDTSHTLPIAVSMLLVGSSVGIVIPIMPYVVSNLGLSAGQYGLVVSSFAFAKLFANVPAAVFVEKQGRKPHLVYSLIVISAGVGGIGLASSFEHLVLCRVLTGIGVSSLSTAATLANADSSTPLNRASTMAPMMSAFAAGTALGPVMGGVLADYVGIESTFYLVGCIYLALTAINNMTLNETKLPSLEERQLPWSDMKNSSRTGTSNGEGDISKKEDENVLSAMKDATSQWLPLLRVESVRNVVIMNGFYWIALSGSQMTLLPLILTNPEGLAFTATQVGQVYMGMSLVQVLGNPAMATVIDKIGKVPGILIGCTLLSSSMFALPYCNEMSQVIATCGTWALGSTMLATAPVSLVSDNVSDRERPQAIALYRTAGDIGFLLGAASTGAYADAFSMDIAVHSNAGMLLTATGWFATRSFLLATRKSLK